MSSIIKSDKVSMGKTVAVELDLPRIIKKSKPVEDNIGINQIQEENIQDNQEENLTETIEEKVVVTDEEKEKILSQFMEEARKKSELFFEEEMKKAYEEGIKRAEQDAQNIIEQANNNANQIVIEAEEIRKKAIEDYNQAFIEMEPQLVDLAVDIAEKILNTEIKKDEKYIINIVKDVMDKVSSKKDIILKVSENDYKIINENIDLILTKIEGFADVKIIKEPSLSDGSCIVDTDYGTIDGGLQTRIEQVKSEIEKMLNR